MPNWIEAVIAYLKQNTSLRFNMVWLFTWLLLLFLIPDSVVNFINGKINFFNIPYIGVILTLIPVSFFISDFLKWLYSVLRRIYKNTNESLKFKRAKKEIQSLPDEEKEIILEMIDYQNKNGHIFNEEDNIYLLSLLDKGIVRVVFDRYATKYDMDGYYKQAAISLMVDTYEKERKKHPR